MLPSAATVFEKLPRYLRRHRLMTAWMKLTGEAPLQLVRIRDEHLGYADMSDGFLRLIVIDQGFEKEFFELADRVMAQGGTFFDVGANHGLLSFGLAGRHEGRIDFHLFEPNPKLVDSIRKSQALYPTMRLTLNAAAVSDHEGVVSFQVNESQTGTSHICSEGAGLEVPSLMLDRYIEKRGLRRVELMKLDIEGYELLALQGARHALERRIFQAIYFEYFEKWLTRVSAPARLLEYLDAMGYQVCLCRSCDILSRGGAIHTFAKGLAGHGIRLLPITGHSIPAATDLLAVPKENLERADSDYARKRDRVHP